MREVKPPEATAALKTLLASDQFVMADLYELTLRSGTILRYTSHDMPLKVGGVTYAADGPLIERGTTSVSVGLEVDTLSLEITAEAFHLVDGVPFTRAALTGAFKGGELVLDRVFAPSWDEEMVASVGIYAGRIANINYENGLQMEVKSHTELLDANVPRNIFQPPCMNTLYDAGCGVNRADRLQTGAIIGCTQTSITTTITDKPAGYFALGVLTFTSGVNSGITRSVKADIPGRIDFALPLAKVSSPGDTFNIVPGCDRAQATCANKFSNLIRFRGAPYIPSPETAAPG